MLLLLLACDPKAAGGPEASFESGPLATPTDARDVLGNAGPSCGPVDQAAVVFTFGLPASSCTADAAPDSLIRLAVWQAGPLAVGTYNVGDPEVGSAYTGSISAESGALTIIRWDAASGLVSGHYELEIAGGAIMHDRFEQVPWCDDDLPMCG